MSNENAAHETPTRREYVKYGGTVIGGGVLAGCTGSDETQEATPTASDIGDSTPTSTVDTEYSVTMAPMGEVAFDDIPQDVFTILGHHADMVLALGQGDAINAMHAPEYHQSLYEKLLHRLDGVTVDWEGLSSSWPPSKEKLYELDSDVHLADPAKVLTTDAFDVDDIEEIEANIAPWFGNTLSDTHQEPPAEYADGYEYYTLWEIFEKVAEVFQEEQRYSALAEVHQSMLERIEQHLPPESERPTAAMVLFSGSDETIWGYELNQPGYYAAHTRPFGATDALSAVRTESNRDEYGNLTLDSELLIEADPDVLLVLGPMAQEQGIDDIRTRLDDDPVAREVSAVANGRVYTQGARRQGPILNLFQLEMTAKQLYPDQFGAWPGYTDGPYPEIPAEEELFDRERVANTITGGV